VEDVIQAKGPKCGQYKSAAAFLLSLSALSLKKKMDAAQTHFGSKFMRVMGPVMDIRYPMQAQKVHTRTQNGFWQLQNVSGHHEMHLGWGKWAASGRGKKKKADSTFERLAIRTLGQFTIFLQHTLFFLLVEKVNSLS
jgi:hypothetical protein